MQIKPAFAGRAQHLATVLAAVVIFFAGFAVGDQRMIGAAQSDTRPPAGIEEAFAPFWQTYNLIVNQYVDPVEPEVLVEGAITGMIEVLDDQYSGYMDPEVFPLLNDDLEGEIQGIGVVISTNPDTSQIEVVGVMNGAPAQEAGILIGDIFAEVDGVDVIGLSQLELAALVRGEEGTRVTIVMLRGDQRVTFEMTRARIEIPNVESEIVDNNIAYVKLNQFSAEARGELEQAITALDVNRRAGLIVDFRDNPGGLLSSAIEVASAFIPDGPVVIEDFGDGEERVFNANQDALDIHVPIILLVNEASASASELVAGALQDTERATILGETTLGKGTVQTWNSLANGGGVRLTIARWLTPNRSWIHEVGITPDVVVEWTPQSYDDANDPQLDAAIYRLTAKVRQAHLQSIPYPAVQVD